uniref:Uncharacterized protein n=1 Tax=Ditylum brightwellii TaxID=49249 RepID=A0A6U3W9W4_9STRA|mmetsp:Transcript_14167/g.18869  ORF Transcript_14167/g.18869 Transcript_14167/m.18869 type:complete len:101 (+) Transcript_14167:188-490(+)|eukprot:10367256-Ditylum_brightwellii.AAC.1
MPQSNDVVNLWLYFDEWTRCISSRYQRDSLYRKGNFDGCSAQYADLKAAMKAKTMNDPEEAIKLMETTHYKRTLGSDPATSPTAGYIWDLKSKPSWDAEE